MPEVSASKYVVSATWEDAPHLDRQAKEDLWESIPPHQRDARSKGVPQLGSGAIFPIVEQRIAVDDFEIPSYWPRAYGLDVGWNWTAAVWGAWDRQSDIVYLYSCHKQGKTDPATHVDAIKSRGTWIPGAIDPASQGVSQRDGKNLYDDYVRMGLELYLANNAVEAGIHSMYRRLVSGRLKVFKSLAQWFEEYRLYRRDDKGRVVKDNDHLMDATRYLVMSGMEHAIDEALATNEGEWDDFDTMRGRNETTGY